MDGLLAVILAAGWGRRMGGPKARLADPAGRTFLELALDAVAAADPDATVAVVGPWWDAAVDPAPDADLAVNPDPDRGPISSIRCALAHAGPEWAGLLVALVDHPLVRPDTVEALADAWRETPDRIVLPALETPGGRLRGHPVIFPGWALAELAGAAADAGGARVVVQGNAARVREVVVADPGIRMDLDTEEGYRTAFGRPPGRP